MYRRTTHERNHTRKYITCELQFISTGEKKLPKIKLHIGIIISVFASMLLVSTVFSSITSVTIISNSGTIAYVLPLHVEGKYIKDSAGRIVYLRGINKHGFENHPGGHWQRPDGGIEWNTFNPSVVAANLDAMKSWGINVVRCYSTAQFWIENTGNHRGIVKQLAALLAQRGMYLIYTFWHTTPTAPQESIPFPTETFPNASAFVNMWGSIAMELKDYHNVIFALWNEPYGDDRIDEWFNVTQSCITAIRNAGARNLIIVQWEGIWYNLGGGFPPTNQPTASGATMWWVKGKPLNDPLGNLVYEFHNYRGGLHKFVGGQRVNCWEYQDLKTGFQYGLVEYVLNNLTKPVICGEIGPNMWHTGEELQRELDYYRNSLQIFSEWQMHYLGFWWWPAWTHAHLTGGPNYEPNSAGEILKSALSYR